MSRRIGVAIGSTASLPGQVERNLAQIEAFARRAAAEGMDVLLTPEMSASGYGGYPEVLAVAEVAGKGPIYRGLARIALETGVVVAAGFCESDAGQFLISHYVVWPDGKFIVQRKHGVTPAEAPLTKAGCGLDLVPFRVGDVQCAIVICADAGAPDRDDLAREAGVELLFLPTGAGGKRHDRVTTAELASEAGREVFLRMSQATFWPGAGPRECLEQGRAMACVNMMGYDGKDHYHLGHGSIINALGEVVGFFPGIVNLDRQKPCYASAILEADSWPGAAPALTQQELVTAGQEGLS